MDRCSLLSGVLAVGMLLASAQGQDCSGLDDSACSARFNRGAIGGCSIGLDTGECRVTECRDRTSDMNGGQASDTCSLDPSCEYLSQYFICHDVGAPIPCNAFGDEITCPTDRCAFINFGCVDPPPPTTAAPIPASEPTTSEPTTSEPTPAPTAYPTISTPTSSPTSAPSHHPSMVPTQAPTTSPTTSAPTPAPTRSPLYSRPTQSPAAPRTSRPPAPTAAPDSGGSTETPASTKADDEAENDHMELIFILVGILALGAVMGCVVFLHLKTRKRQGSRGGKSRQPAAMNPNFKVRQRRHRVRPFLAHFSALQPRHPRRVLCAA